MGAERVHLLNPRTWLSRRSTKPEPVPPDVLARIRTQEAEMDRQMANDTLGSDAATAEELERRLLS
ncbi:hypothetical protein [Candidatus Poriferisocius sp.]|uniref:hypothetical protein n=1 Tax=Candidatus Poriferisocius sp. TaxID=3101276 RepID=UPI003B019DFE